MSLDLPLIWAGVIAGAVMLYVMLDGFDLGIGMLFPFAHSPSDRDAMMNAIAPVWDGNETWLVLGGGGLLAAFPLAYATLLPALYLPIMTMLLALVLRGVAFEFRLRGRSRGKRIWTIAFAGGSLIAAISQGLALGGFIQGVKAGNGVFLGGPFDWLTPYSLVVACGLVAGYMLLGAGWLIYKTEDRLHADARRWAIIAGVAAVILLALVSVATLLLQSRIEARWGLAHGMVDWRRLGLRAPIPLLGLFGIGLATRGLMRRGHLQPFIGGLLVFLSGYLGLAASFMPYIVPYALTYRQAAAADNALALMLGGLVILAPAILGYTVWVYWIFRGKVAADAGYH